jgi:hypothetical protein
MTHPIVALQGALVAALLADAELAALVGANVFDAPPKGAAPPYVAIARHDLMPRDGDGTPGCEHRLGLHAWAAEPSRRAALAMAERVLAVALSLDEAGELAVTTRLHERTETAIDLATGRARAAVALRFFTEPNG